MKSFLPLILIFASCSSPTGVLIKEAKQTYNYYDTTGKWYLFRESKALKNKVVTRVSIRQTQNSDKPLEKSITVSQVGSTKGPRGRSLVIRPLASEYSVWLEGKEYSSKLNLDTKSKSMMVELNSPESKWQGSSKIRFPNSQYFCFFSQIPECLLHGQLFEKAMNRKGTPVPFIIVWDSYPYIQEQLSSLGKNLFSSSSLIFENEKKELLYFQVEVDGQTILYQFSKTFELVRIYWVAQGVSVIPINEELQVE